MSLSCLEFRQHVSAVPGSRDSAVLEHRLQCRACAAFAEEQLALDYRLEKALRIPVPDELKARVIWHQAGGHRQRIRYWRRAAFAAGIVLMAGAGAILGQFTNARVLPADVVAHIEHEPARLFITANAPEAEPVRVNTVLESGGIHLLQPLSGIVSAGLCPFRGRMVPHLVMRVDGEPVSILLLPDEPSGALGEIHEDGYHGVIVPHAGGSMVIVAARPDLVTPARQQLEQAVTWRL